MDTPTTTPAAATDPGTMWNRMRHWVFAHAVDDFYQGLVPASIPFFVLERGYSYVAASGLALAAALGSSLPQPLLGVLVDRRRLLWLAPAGLLVAGAGAGLAGLAPAYPMVWLLILISGIGIAAFHPAAGRDARLAAADSTVAMSYFAAGGSVGFFLAPALATPCSRRGVSAPLRSSSRPRYSWRSSCGGISRGTPITARRPVSPPVAIGGARSSCSQWSRSSARSCFSE